MEVKQETSESEETSCKIELDNEEFDHGTDGTLDDFKIEIEKEPKREPAYNAFDYLYIPEKAKVEQDEYKFNICEETQTTNEEKMEPDVCASSLYIHLDNEAILNESKSIVMNLSQGTKKEEIMKEKEKIIEEFLNATEKIYTKEQLDILRKTVAPLAPNLKALDNTVQAKITLLKKKNKMPHNKKIQTQRRLYSTKKKTRKIQERMLSKDLLQMKP
ncbi:uncharacterized protein LOC126879809 [Diabrotica virgifera virgifera]|uniref:Uncharacterized protein n=1 Tax=Diabrotica virgifera virgifera TaxID=50390 RepID=A0ABM5JM67_DIAVI|nr:uncharacterized protein LOC126879809 [Diabrotica virgifera virgifera]